MSLLLCDRSDRAGPRQVLADEIGPRGSTREGDGAIDFFRRHRSELQHPVALVLEMLGCAGPAWLTHEGILVPFHADPELVRLAEQLATQHPEWGAHAAYIQGGNTEMADAVRAGVPAITLQGMGPGGELPFWHQPEDTFDKIDPEILQRAYAFTCTFVQALDERAVENSLIEAV